MYLYSLHLRPPNILYIYESIIRQVSTQYNVPRRALLYVPGDSERKLAKSFTLNVDCVVMDCEDGVAISKKARARETIHSVLNNKKERITRDLAVRVNSIDSGLCGHDLQSILRATNLPNTLVLPKINGISHLKWLSDELNKYKANNTILNLILLIESALAMINLPQLCKTAAELSTRSKFNPVGLIFGSDDFCASIGVTRSEDSFEILYARQKLVLVAKAFGLQAIDMVHINYKDTETLRTQCEQGKRFGYTGKQVIHPDQVPIVQKLFVPNEIQILWATELLQAFEQHQKSGQGAFTYNGCMIDMPTVKQAENIVNAAKIYESNDVKK